MNQVKERTTAVVHYPNLNSRKLEAHAAIQVIRLEEDPVVYIVVTDESQVHWGISITNAAEYVYQAAYAYAGYPNECLFLETYPPSPGEERQYDVVTFPNGSYSPDLYGNVRYNNAPQWTPATAELVEKLGL